MLDLGSLQIQRTSWSCRIWNAWQHREAAKAVFCRGSCSVGRRACRVQVTGGWKGANFGIRAHVGV